MKNLPILELPEYFKKYMRYKWEFLRRNKEYIRDWEKLLKITPQESDNAARNFITKWKILDPTNPLATFDELISGVNMRYNFERLNPKLFGIRAIMELDAWEYEKKPIRKIISNHISETGELTIKLDLNYSKTRLIKEFKMFIED